MTRYRNQTTPNSPGTKVFVGVDGRAFVDVTIQKPALHSKQMYDDVIKDYKKRSALGEIFNNQVSISTNDFTADDNYSATLTHKGPQGDPANGQTARYNWGNGALLTTIRGSLPWPSVTFDTTKAAAKAALNAIAAVNKTEADTGNFVGEWSKTKRLHKDLLNGIWDLMVKGSGARVRKSVLKRIPMYDHAGQPVLSRTGKPKYRYIHDIGEVTGTGASIRTRNAANLYLAFRMGVAPLISDLEGACKALVSSKNLRQTARSSESMSDTKRATYVLPDSYGVSHTINLTVVKTWTIRYGILYESTVAGRMAAQFGLTRPLTSAWNLLPWSFVADWFLNVGKWLDAVQPSGASRILSAWVSTHETVVYHADVSSSWNVASGYEHVNGSWSGSMTETHTTKSRAPWVPTVPNAPLAGEGITNLRSFDLAALVLQRIKTRF